MRRPRLRHFVYFVGAVAYLLSVKKPICALQPTELVLPAVILFVTLLVLELYFLISRSYRIKAYLDRADPEKFLMETRKEMEATPGRHWKSFYQINSTAGLYYLGRFDEAIKILDDIDVAKLQRVYRYLYVNNRLANLLGAERIAEAADLVREHEADFQPCRQNQKFYFALQANLGALKYHQGEWEAARHLIEESIKSHHSPLALGVAHYYLGRIAAAQGRKEEARSHFAQARDFGKNSFVVQRLS